MWHYSQRFSVPGPRFEEKQQKQKAGVEVNLLLLFKQRRGKTEETQQKQTGKYINKTYYTSVHVCLSL